MPGKLVSFIIPHYGREHLLLQTLQSISLQNFDIRRVEIHIVTQNSSLSGSITGIRNELSLSIHTRPAEQTISQLRNYGVLQSRGAYLAFIDADIWLSSDWIRCMLEELEKPGERRIIVSSIQDYSQTAGPVEKIRSLLSRIRGDSNVDSLPGSNLFLKASTFHRIGGFPEDMDTCEDIYFTSRAARLGVLYLSAITSHIHLGEDKSFSQLFRKEIWRGASNYSSLKGRSIAIGEIPSLVIPLFVLLTTVATLAFLIFMQPLVALVFWGLSLVPTILYVARLQVFNSIRSLHIYDIARFYFTYFLARALGPAMGIFRR